MEVVYLNRTSRILAGHQWVFSNELAKSPKGYEPGTLVELRDRKDVFIGRGYINPNSLISVRILTREKEEINVDFFRSRILRALEYRKRFFPGEDSFRVIFSEGDFLPGLIVDKYDKCLSVQILTAGIERLSGTIISLLEEIFSPSIIVLRNDGSSRLLEGLTREKKIIKGSLDELPVVHEGSSLLSIDPLSGQKTGFFLDQRENRIAFAELVAKGKGLDLFCYSGAWSMHLAKAGCQVTGIDESENAVFQARSNAELNGLSDLCAFVKSDVFQFLRKMISESDRYDFIVLDPPAFIKSKAKVKEGTRGYREVNANAMRLMKQGGLLATSSCSHHLDRESFIEMLRAAARDAGRQIRILELRPQAKDHPVLLSMSETEYLKCAFLEVE